MPLHGFFLIVRAELACVLLMRPTVSHHLRAPSRAVNLRKQQSQVPIKVTSARRMASGGTWGRIPLAYAGTIFRNGYYYLPRGYYGKPLPVCVMLHGAAQDGYSMVQTFSWLADRYK